MSNEIIPIFPLQMVAFPEETVNLHIFETRYKQLIMEADTHGSTFGIPTYLGKRKLTFGTEVILKEIVKKYKDGKLDIKVKGKRVFKVLNFIPRMSGRLYSGADIEYLDTDFDLNIEKNRAILKMLSQLYQFLKLHRPLPKDEYAFKSFEIGHFIGLSLKDEVKLLSLEKEVDRQDYIIQHMEHILPIMEQMNALEKKVKMNGHFKNFIPPDL